MSFIKVCGITTEAQALEIAKMKPTHIGVIHFEKSPRHIDIYHIKKIKNLLKNYPVKLVAVVVNPKKSLIEELLNIVDIVQLHGDENLDFVKQFNKEKVIKAIRVKDEKFLKEIEKFSKKGYLVLIDAFKKGEYGGTGKQIDKNLVKEVLNITDKFILSGGLSDENVYKLIKEFQPFGVDASSKLEIKPGIKDLKKVKKYIEEAKKALKQ
ncbi:MAG TPA: phosphoribosylanthranilate isomerase [Persephonella sp.]|nr:phosphoribosylanthranilate isomerase [Hydrogenothermaceae bacterium]HIQ25438.1 phosphoribosylanthranilate isomerase [Persephonella sp.]